MKELILYTEADAEKDLEEKKRTAAEASHEKWVCIQSALLNIEDEAGERCGLCMKYKTMAGGCGDCPLYVSGAGAHCGEEYSRVASNLGELNSFVEELVERLMDVAINEAEADRAKEEAKAEKGKFKPITITIDSEEVADYIWHKLNSARGKSYDQYRSGNSYPNAPEPTRELTAQAWQLVDSVHKPEGTL